MSATNHEYNYLQVHNISEKTITVFFYDGFSPVCIFSSFSKILKPEQKCHHYIKEPFKFEIFENKENETKEKCLGPEECNGIRVITVSDGENSLKCQQIDVNEKEKKTIVRRMKRENDLPSTNDATNDERNYLQVHNNSKKTVTVFIYEGFSPVCIFPSLSKILKPEQKCHHYIKEPFKFEIFENKENETKEKHLGPEECNGIRVITVSDGENSLKCEQNTVNEKVKERIVRILKSKNDLFPDCNTESGDYTDNSEAEDRFVQIAADCSFQNIDIQHIENSASLKQVQTKTIMYLSNGAWISKMIVSYSLNKVSETKKVSGDRKRIEISANATDIEVKFQVSRPVWGDVMKYDRFKKKWSTPSEPHIFRYKKAVDRTFTLSGNLWWEAVMAVTDEYHEETKELG